MDEQKLQAILDSHRRWLEGEKGGKRADLTGADLRDMDLRRADLRRADLERADLRRANLEDADLRGAYLYGADLVSANLRNARLEGACLFSANLRHAIFQRADLEDAELSGAEGISPLMYAMTTPMAILRDQPGEIRAYKLVNANYEGPMYGGIRYDVGGEYTAEADDDDCVPCSYGISLADLGWCLEHWRPGYRILIVEFAAKDIAAIPVGGRKFRVSRCRVVGELDLSDYGL